MKSKVDRVLDELLLRDDLKDCDSEFLVWLMDIVEDSIIHYEVLKKEKVWKKSLQESSPEKLKKGVH
jgi:hypothetical protein